VALRPPVAVPQEPERADRCGQVDVPGYLFHGKTRQPFVAYFSFGRSFKRGAKLAGLPEAFTFHQLRHAYATACLAHGVQIHELSKWMGHGSVDVTEN
jgi:integrase